jgi:hypothetical protein
MQFAPPLKPLVLISAATLVLAAGAAHADSPYPGNPGYDQNYKNPPLLSPAYQQARYHADMRGHLAQFNQRLDNQLQRILAGMERAQLTMGEAIGLLREHLDISTRERTYMTDGRLGPDELADLERRLDEAGRHIAFEKHDRERTRGDWRDRDDRHGH